MLATEDLYLAASWTHALDETVRFIRLPARLANLGDDDIGIEATVNPRRELELPIFVKVRLDADQHVLLGVIEPMNRASCSDYSLQLRGGTRENNALEVRTANKGS